MLTAAALVVLILAVTALLLIRPVGTRGGARGRAGAAPPKPEDHGARPSFGRDAERRDALGASAERVNLYEYCGEEVLLVRVGCCDHFTEVYALDGTSLGASFGGFTEKGGGRLLD
jgi:hypothetical protein